MGEIVKPFAAWVTAHIPLSVGLGLFIFCLFFEVSKIKVYPLRWLWKLISWPFKKIDEQRTNSFKAIVASMKADLDTKLEAMQTASNANCDTVKQCISSLESKFSDLEGRFDALDAMEGQTEERLDKLEAARIKNHVFNFARQCRKGELHSHEDFANLFREHSQYEALVEKYQAMDEKHKRDWENNVYVHDFKYIQSVYDECNLKGTFSE